MTSQEAIFPDFRFSVSCCIIMRRLRTLPSQSFTSHLQSLLFASRALGLWDLQLIVGYCPIVVEAFFLCCFPFTFLIMLSSCFTASCMLSLTIIAPWLRFHETTLVTATYQSLDYGNNGATLVVNREIPQASEWEVEPMTSGQTRIGEERYQRLTTIESDKYQNVKKASSALLLKVREWRMADAGLLMACWPGSAWSLLGAALEN